MNKDLNEWVMRHPGIIGWAKENEKLCRWLQTADELLDFGNIRISYHQGHIANYRLYHGAMQIPIEAGGSTILITGSDVTINTENSEKGVAIADEKSYDIDKGVGAEAL